MQGKIVWPYGDGRIKDWGKKKSMEASDDVSLINKHSGTTETQKWKYCALQSLPFLNPRHFHSMAVNVIKWAPIRIFAVSEVEAATGATIRTKKVVVEKGQVGEGKVLLLLLTMVMEGEEKVVVIVVAVLLSSKRSSSSTSRSKSFCKFLFCHTLWHLPVLFSRNVHKFIF